MVPNETLTKDKIMKTKIKTGKHHTLSKTTIAPFARLHNNITP
jgi:hypothetical protein